MEIHYRKGSEIVAVDYLSRYLMEHNDFKAPCLCVIIIDLDLFEGAPYMLSSHIEERTKPTVQMRMLYINMLSCETEETMQRDISSVSNFIERSQAVALRAESTEVNIAVVIEPFDSNYEEEYKDVPTEAELIESYRKL